MRQSRADCRIAQLRALVRQASSALIRLDAQDLEELAVKCRDYSADQGGASLAQIEKTTELRAALEELTGFRYLLSATRANVEVLRRLSRLLQPRLEYATEDRRSAKDR